MKLLMIMLAMFVIITQTSDTTYTVSDGSSSAVVVVT